MTRVSLLGVRDLFLSTSHVVWRYSFQEDVPYSESKKVLLLCSFKKYIQRGLGFRFIKYLLLVLFPKYHWTLFSPVPV